MPAPSKKPQRATIRDVAEQAGVSISTVSHVFSGGRPISKQTQERVREVAKRLRYRADPSAKSLRMARTGVIGLILRPRDAIAGSKRGTMTFIRLMGSIAAHTLEQGRGLVNVPDILDPSVAQVPMDVCIVAHPYGSDEVLTYLISQDLPVVTIDIDPDRPDFPWSVKVDYATPMKELLDTALAHGARRILYLSGTEDNDWGRSTVAAYTEWCTEHALPQHHLEIFEGATVAEVQDLIVPILRSDARPDAIICAASSAAATVLRTAQNLGLSIPDDLMLAALTESESTRATNPPITALDLRLEESAALGTELAIRHANGEAPPAEQPVNLPELVWRTTLPRVTTTA